MVQLIQDELTISISIRDFDSGSQFCIFFLSLGAQARRSDLSEKRQCAVHSALGACGMHEAVGASRQRRRRWVQSHSRPAAIQALGRRERRFAAPAGPSVARSPVLRAPGAGRVLELVRCARLLLAGLKSACVA